VTAWRDDSSRSRNPAYSRRFRGIDPARPTPTLAGGLKPLPEELRSAADSFDTRKRNVGGLGSALRARAQGAPRRLDRLGGRTRGVDCDVFGPR